MNALLHELKSALADCSVNLFLYGSQRDGLKLGSDLDLVIVHSEASRMECVRRLSMVQKKTPILLHGIFVTPQEIRENSHLARIVALARTI